MKKAVGNTFKSIKRVVVRTFTPNEATVERVGHDLKKYLYI